VLIRNSFADDAIRSPIRRSPLADDLSPPLVPARAGADLLAVRVEADETFTMPSLPIPCRLRDSVTEYAGDVAFLVEQHGDGEVLLVMKSACTLSSR
jgi:hypothetical protein